MDIVSLLPSLLLGLLCYLLQQKDAKQEKEIKRLFELHDSDAAKLVELQIQIAEKHYPKNELDAKLTKLETSLLEGINRLNSELGNKFDKLSDALIAHITLEGTRKNQ